MLLLSACGGDSAEPDPVAAANEVNTADFPKTDGKKTLKDLQLETKAAQDANLLPASNNFPAGRENRLPFALFDAERKPFWGPTMMYFAVDDGPAQGPFPVKAHGFDVAAEFQSETSKSDINAIGNGFYTTELPAEKAGAMMSMRSTPALPHSSTTSTEYGRTHSAKPKRD